jgi:hypothetical protein
MEQMTSASDTAGMDGRDQRLIIVRAWREAGGVRVRLLADGPPERQWVVATIPDAAEVMFAVLSELLRTVDGP